MPRLKAYGLLRSIRDCGMPAGPRLALAVLMGFVSGEGRDAALAADFDEPSASRVEGTARAARIRALVAGESASASTCSISTAASRSPSSTYAMLGIAAGDPRPLTVTGGLPYFGGAGNDYSMHAIASMVRRLRAHPSETGLAGANGGALSKYSVGVYSARRSAWRDCDGKSLQAEIDSWPTPPQAIGDGEGVVETYMIDHSGKAPLRIVVGRLDGSRARFVSGTAGSDHSVVRTMLEAEPLGARVVVKPDETGRSIIRSLEPA